MVMMMRHAYRHVCRGTSGRNWEFMGFFFFSLLVFVSAELGWLGMLSCCVQ